MSAFGNATFNRIHAHSALQSFAENGAGVFVFVYLLKSGISAPLVLLAIAAQLACRFVLRQLVLPIVMKLGLRNTLIAGIAAEALSFLVLSQVDGLSAPLFLFLALSAWGGCLYWTCLHAYIALLGDDAHRGAQISAKEAVRTIAAIAAPLATGLLLVWFGPLAAFVSAAIVLACAAIPLAGAADPAVQPNVCAEPELLRQGRNIFIADGGIAAAHHFVWTIALFQTLGENYASFGGTLTLASLFGAVATYFLGPLMDRRHAGKLLAAGFAALSAATLVKAFGYAAVWSAVSASVIGAAVFPIFYPIMMAPVYRLSRSSVCPLRFHIAAEGGWDIGCAAGCIAAAGVIHAGYGYFWPILTGLAAGAAGYQLIARRPLIPA